MFYKQSDTGIMAEVSSPVLLDFSSHSDEDIRTSRSSTERRYKKACTLKMGYHVSFRPKLCPNT